MKIVLLVSNVEKYGGAGQATYVNIMRHMSLHGGWLREE